MTRHPLLGLATFTIAAALCAFAGPVRADRITHPTAVFSGLDKITGRIISFEVASNETVQFGSLQITERACYTRPATEAPQTTAFAEVEEIDAKKQYKRIFSGWMFAASPGLNPIEHPVYDIWLTDCKGGTQVEKAPQTAAAEVSPPPNAEPPAKPEKKKRVAKRKPAPADDGGFDAGPVPPEDVPRRASPSRQSSPDAADGRDPAGFY